MRYTRYIFSALLFFLFSNVIIAQQIQTFGKAGVLIDLGTHNRRIGLSLHLTILYGSFQYNTLGRVLYNFKTLGPVGRFKELQLSNGLQWGWHNSSTKYDTLAFANSSAYYGYKLWHCGYTYNIYIDTRHTSQSTASLNINYKGWMLATENDALAFTAWDRFRTGSIKMQYHNQYYSIAQSIKLWTGQHNHQPIIYNDSNSLYKNGYVDITNSPYGEYSHGLYYIEFSHTLPFNQNGFIQIGLDNEKLRNAIQNKLIHQSKLLHLVNPNVRHPAIPMLDIHQKMFLDPTHQKIKKGKPLFQIGLNAIDTY